MTREEIMQQGRPVEPNCFETDREEQWYKVGLYDGAMASLWHSVADGDLPKRDILENHALIVFGAGIGFEYDVQYVAEDKCFGFSIFNGFDEDDNFEVLAGVEYWMEIPKLPKKGGEK